MFIQDTPIKGCCSSLRSLKIKNLVKVNDNFCRYSAIRSNVKGPIKHTGGQAMEFSDKVLMKNDLRKIKMFQGLIFLNTLKSIREFLNLKRGNTRENVCVIVNFKENCNLVNILSYIMKKF